MEDFRKGDAEGINLVLRSRGNRNVAGCRLELIAPGGAGHLMAAWNLGRPIRSTDIGHPEYRAILDSIIAGLGVRQVLVSSVVGHALDVLDTGLPTVLVLHDLYPFCPAMFACFGSPCTDCEPSRLEGCLRANPYNLFWHNTSVSDWRRLRESYAAHIRRPEVRLVAPTRSVRDRWVELLPEMAGLPWQLIPHGLDPAHFPAGISVRHFAAQAGDRLRIVIPGRLAPHKGLHLLREALPQLTQVADILLLGCGDFGRVFEGREGVRVIPQYERAELAVKMRAFSPDCALLLATLPESFSYTLSEMFALGLPVLATRIGAFEERIADGETGLLFKPEPAQLVACVQRIASNRVLLKVMAANIAAMPERGIADMVRDYRALLPRPEKCTDPVLLTGVEEALTNNASQFSESHRQQQQRIVELNAEHETSQRHQQMRIEGLAAECEALRNSRSWRITVPLRTVSNILRRTGVSAPPVTLQIADSGLLPSTAMLAPGENIPATAGLMEGVAEDEGIAEGVMALLAKAGAEVRRRIRKEIRHAFGLPDAVHVVAGFFPEDPREADRLARVVLACVATRNDVCVVLYGDAADMDIWGRQREDMALLVATRRLFVSRGARPRLLVGADIFVAPEPGRAGSVDACLAAARAGLPLFVFDSRQVPGGIAQPRTRVLPSADLDASVAVTLSAWLDPPIWRNTAMAPIDLLIIGTPYSGSTLFANALNGHRLIANAGELSACFPGFGLGTAKPFCPLCAVKKQQCPVWTEAFFESLQVAGPAQARARFRAVTQAPVVVDSSKFPAWLDESWRPVPWVETVLLVVSRNPFAYLVSNRRRVGAEAALSAQEWVGCYRKTFEWIRQYGLRTHLVRYEDFALMPERELADLMTVLDLPWDPGMLRFWKSPMHALNGDAGAYMRFPEFVQDAEFETPEDARVAAEYAAKPFGGWTDDKWIGAVTEAEAEEFLAGETGAVLRHLCSEMGYDLDQLIDQATGR